jgi:hypothetical protein
MDETMIIDIAAENPRNTKTVRKLLKNCGINKE